MKNRNLILMLVDKSANAFGELIGLTEDEKLKVALTIIQGTTKSVFGIDLNLLTSKALAEILLKGELDYDQTCLLTNLMCAQAEILLKLKQPIDSLRYFENALHILQWQTQQTIKKMQLEKQNKIVELRAIIEKMQRTICN
ncbi:MAG: hypothetical protein V4549_02825 [Bacteroidota bacterium]